MRYICLTALALLLALQGYAAPCNAEAVPQKTVHPDTVPGDSAETTRHWNIARKYKTQMRFELAKQHLLLALSACRSDITMQRIQRELQIVELQIRSMR